MYAQDPRGWLYDGAHLQVGEFTSFPTYLSGNETNTLALRRIAWARVPMHFHDCISLRILQLLLATTQRYAAWSRFLRLLAIKLATSSAAPHEFWYPAALYNMSQFSTLLLHNMTAPTRNHTRAR